MLSVPAPRPLTSRKGFVIAITAQHERGAMSRGRGWGVTTVVTRATLSGYQVSKHRVTQTRCGSGVAAMATGEYLRSQFSSVNVGFGKCLIRQFVLFNSILILYIYRKNINPVWDRPILGVRGVITPPPPHVPSPKMTLMCFSDRYLDSNPQPLDSKQVLASTFFGYSRIKTSHFQIFIATTTETYIAHTSETYIAHTPEHASSTPQNVFTTMLIGIHHRLTTVVTAMPSSLPVSMLVYTCTT